MTSNGTQYDRLGVFTFHNTESGYEYLQSSFAMSLNTDSVWRTSTPEPTRKGIIWTYTKDVTRYIPLFAEPGTFILELNNIVQTGLNGEYASAYLDSFRIPVLPYGYLSTATLYATFYAASQDYPTAGQSNIIVPITTMLNNTGDEASVPPAFSVSQTLVSACRYVDAHSS